MSRYNNPRKFLLYAETLQMQEAIKKAESKTSAEIKVVIARHCLTDIKKKAFKIFKKFELDKTEKRNAVLVLLITTNREFLVYGDEGIHEKVGQNFWDDVRNIMIEKFKKDEFGEGFSDGITKIGEKLANFFPIGQGDVNEVSNEISYYD